LEGRIHRVDVAAGPIGQEVFPTSTHAIGLVESVEIGRALGRLPAVTILYGIEVGSTEIGSGLTPAVAAAADEVVGRMLREVDEWNAPGEGPRLQHPPNSERG
jgi:hydrogenase maturation protease